MPSTRDRFVQLIGLTAFAVAWPLLDLMTRHADFLVIHRCGPGEIAALLVLLFGAVPLLGWLIQLALGRWPRLVAAVHSASLAGLMYLLVVVPLGRVEELAGGWPSAIALLLAIGGAVLARRTRWVRRMLVWWAAAVPVFAVMFLMHQSIRTVLSPRQIQLTQPERSAQATDVVLLILDALPLSSLLLDEDIDAARLPNFDRLARQSTWWPNAVTVSDATVRSVPAILTGREPVTGKLGVVSDYPLNLFTILADTHRMVVEEPATQLCPEDDAATPRPGLGVLVSDLSVLYLHLVVPAPWRDRLPSVSNDWMGFAGTQDRRPSDGFGAWLKRVAAEPGPAVYMAHLVLPHGPYHYLPDGTVYDQDGVEPSGEGDQWGAWSDDEWSVQQSYQRHLLQLSYTDLLLGRLLDRLEATGLWESAVIAVTADHGVSFRPGDYRRALSATNQADILRVPLFIRFPGQAQAERRDDPARVVDLLPTVLDVLGVAPSWHFDGVSLTQAGRNSDPSPRPDIGPTVVRQRHLFQNGLYAMGDRFGWVGQAVPSMVEPSSLVVTIDDLDRYDQVSSPFGTLSEVSGSADADESWLAVAVNDTVRAVTRTYRNGSRQWSAVIDPVAWRAGANQVQVFEVSPRGGLLRPRRLD